MKFSFVPANDGPCGHAVIIYYNIKNFSHSIMQNWFFFSVLIIANEVGNCKTYRIDEAVARKFAHRQTSLHWVLLWKETLCGEFNVRISSGMLANRQNEILCWENVLYLEYLNNSITQIMGICKSLRWN